MSNRFDLEKQYLAAKESYYNGSSILTDDEFDYLESQLISLGSEVPYIVGAEDRKAKYSHPSPMLSLAKYQATVNGIPPTAQAVSWMNNIPGNQSFEITPKYDGNAANVIYIDGKLSQVISRGDGSKGRDITEKIKHNFPERIDLQGTVEIRGEVVIKVSTFNEKFSNYKNPRNFVAGILNRDDNTQEVLSLLDFIPLEVRQHTGVGTIYIAPRIPGFTHTPHIFYIHKDNFEVAYHDMVEFRKTSEYQLDGFVIKTPEFLRYDLGENSHDPNWAVAIKFPPKETLTTIERIVWQYGKTGKLSPVAVMKPVDLDGSTVTRAALFNYGYVKSLKAYPGATVAIAKSGDIIPQILRVISSGDESLFSHPTTCECGEPLKINGIHLQCDSANCSVIAKHMFGQSVGVLDLDGTGGAMVQTLWNAGFKTALDFLNPAKFNKEILISTGHFKDGKTLDNLLQQVNRIKEIKPAQILMMLGFTNMGWTIAGQLGKYLHGEEYSFHGLQKDVIAGFEPGQWKREKYESACVELSGIVKITLPEKISEDSIGCEFTGSPKSAGYKTKEEFLAYAKTKGYYHTGLKNAKVLFTDDINSSSSKIQTAKSKGVKIYLYSDI
jgi:DNA ligase (NAD+)